MYVWSSIGGTVFAVPREWVIYMSTAVPLGLRIIFNAHGDSQLR